MTIHVSKLMSVVWLNKSSITMHVFDKAALKNKNNTFYSICESSVSIRHLFVCFFFYFHLFILLKWFNSINVHRTLCESGFGRIGKFLRSPQITISRYGLHSSLECFSREFISRTIL